MILTYQAIIFINYSSKRRNNMNSFEHEGLYTCKCGKQFTKSQSFNAHKSNCIEILGKDRYEKKLEISKAGLKKATQVAADNAKRKRQELLDL